MRIKVRATANGFRHGARVRAGQEFELDEGEKLGSWMEEVDGDKAQTKPPKKPVNGDTKPKATQEAVKEKVTEANSLI